MTPRLPQFRKFDSLEDYEDTLRAYESALSDYEDECLERHFESRCEKS